MFKILAIISSFFPVTIFSQYYYKDIISNKQAKDNYLLLKKNNIKKVALISVKADGEPVEGFSVQQEINSTSNEVITRTESLTSNSSVLNTQYQPDGLPLLSIDSSEATVSITKYFYSDDEDKSLINISSQSHEPDSSNVIFKEERYYSYNGRVPTQLIRVKNQKDSIHIQFVTEQHGWVAEEKWIQKGRLTETYYYYYNENGQLTDIARYNKEAKMILPDYTFEYDEKGRIVSMTTVDNGSMDYHIWKYTYNENGLKNTEAIYNRKKQVEAQFVYKY